MTTFLSLPAAAWLGRLITWTLLAWSWQRLSWAVAPRRWMSLLTAVTFVWLLDQAHLAGEWVVGGVEAKGFAFALVFFGLEAVARNRWKHAWPLLGAAAAFHVLVGGWAVVAVGCAWIGSWIAAKRNAGENATPEPESPPTLWAMLPSLLLGGLLSLPGLLPAVALSRGFEAELVDRANMIYVYTRLPHHLLIEAFPYWRIQRHLALLGFWLVLWTWAPKSTGLARVQRAVAGAVLIALCGAVIDFLADGSPALKAGLMRFYWFRLSDCLLPLGAALGTGAVLALWEVKRPRLAGIAVVAMFAGAVILMADRVHYRVLDFRPAAETQALPFSLKYVDEDWRAYQDWQEMCNWIETNTPTDALILTPRGQQTFKWHAGRSEVVNWKDLPQDAQSVVEWYDRHRDIYYDTEDGQPAYISRKKLDRLAETYEFEYVLVNRRLDRYYTPRYWKLEPVHENEYYILYRMPRESD